MRGPRNCILAYCLVHDVSTGAPIGPALMTHRTTERNDVPQRLIRTDWPIPPRLRGDHSELRSEMLRALNQELEGLKAFVEAGVNRGTTTKHV